MVISLDSFCDKKAPDVSEAIHAVIRVSKERRKPSPNAGGEQSLLTE
ncbi:hypothetical protein AB7W40_10050 [Providencia rettgeri]